MTLSEKTVHAVIALPASDEITGGPRRVLTLCGQLECNGIRVTALAAENGVVAQAARDAYGFRVQHLDLPGPLQARHGSLLRFDRAVAALWAVVVFNLRVARALRALGADILWLRGAKGVGLYAVGARLAGVRVVWDVDYEPPSRGVARLLHRIGLSSSALVVTQYRKAAEAIFGPRLARRYSNKLAAMIPGIDTERLAPFRQRREERPGQRDTFTILHVGTVSRRKAQGFTLDVLAGLRQRLPDASVRVLFAGGEYEQDYALQVRQRCQDLGLAGHVAFLGWRDDVLALMSEADALVLPSLDEGVPNAVQEAMYIGLPVLAADVGGVSEIIEHGKTGWVLPNSDPGPWVNILTRLITEPGEARVIEKPASRYAEAVFGARQWAERYAAIILQLIYK